MSESVMPYLTDNPVAPLTATVLAVLVVPLLIGQARELLAPVVNGLRRRHTSAGTHRRGAAR